MTINFEPFFKKYEALLKLADDVFDRMKKEHPEELKCKTGCADCCHALFDLTLIEALYINHQFNQKYSAEGRARLLEKANRADRKIHKIKKKAYQALKGGKAENEILSDMAQERARCPLLNEEELCELYQYRPITCRFYGIPTSIGGAGHTCGESGFKPGEKYPTVNFDVIHQKLYALSSEVTQSIGSKHIDMATMLVPLSMALITEYTDEYLGIETETSKKDQQGGADA